MSEYGDSFIGNFLWFSGVIEDVNDPEEMGRYRVRCFGYHSGNKGDLPTEDLPWSNVMMPVTSASTSGIGFSATGLVQGSWVIGFFRDGLNAQDPVIMGSMPSMYKLPDDSPQPPFNYDVGFTDPDQVYPLTESIGKPDTPQAARRDYKDSAVYISKEKTQSDVSKVETANGGVQWSLKTVSDNVAPLYPKNQVRETESGHVIEFDDTTDKERISTFHKSGTYSEITSEGDKTIVIQGDSYEVVIKNKNVYIKGDLNLNVDGDMKTKVVGNYDLEVTGNVNETIGGNQTITVGGSQDITASITNINNNVNVVGTLDATVDVVAGSKNISLVGHKHTDTAGVKPGITTAPN